MRQLKIATLVSLLLFPLACNRPKLAEQQSGPQSREGAFGTSRTRIGDFEGRTPHYLDGDLMVYMPLSGYPGKPLGPAYLLVMRLNPAMPTLFDSGLNVSGDLLQINPAQTDSKGRTFRFEYKVSGKPPTEEFSAGGQTYKPERGRVFLVDLTADPPAISQVHIDLAGALARADQDPTLVELRAAVETLAGKEKSIRDFLSRIEKSEAVPETAQPPVPPTTAARLPLDLYQVIHCKKQIGTPRSDGQQVRSPKLEVLRSLQ